MANTIDVRVLLSSSTRLLVKYPLVYIAYRSINFVENIFFRKMNERILFFFFLVGNITIYVKQGPGFEHVTK